MRRYGSETCCIKQTGELLQDRHVNITFQGDHLSTSVAPNGTFAYVPQCSGHKRAFCSSLSPHYSNQDHQSSVTQRRGGTLTLAFPPTPSSTEKPNPHQNKPFNPWAVRSHSSGWTQHHSADTLMLGQRKIHAKSFCQRRVRQTTSSRLREKSKLLAV